MARIQRVWPGGTPLKGVEATPASTLDRLCYYEMTSTGERPLG